jgi:chemotaxis protein methyltransferase CheR
MRAPLENQPETISYEELDRLNTLIDNIYGYHFSDYSPASLKRRVSRIMELQKLSLFELRNRITNSASFFQQFLKEITVNVTEMFRDPVFYRTLKTEVLPYMESFPKINVWHAGCSTGEELYSFAILFKEANLYERSFFYGTDINSEVLEKAKDGIYELPKMKVNDENYTQTGALNTLSDYYTAKHEAAFIHHMLKKNVLFSTHNLVTDGVFNEFQLISCRNVLIYFNIELQLKVIDLFYRSLANFGFLCLGAKETLRTEDLKRFKVVDKQNKIYQKIA